MLYIGTGKKIYIKKLEKYARIMQNYEKVYRSYQTYATIMTHFELKDM